MTPDKTLKSALAYLARSPKTILEMRRYLSGKNADPEIIDGIIDRLLELKYLDDRAYARQFIDSRIRFKPKSAYAIGYELRGKGIAPAVADEFLTDIDDFQLAFSAAERKNSQLCHLDPESRKKKVLNHLRYRGFDYQVCQAVWKKLMES